MKKKTHEEYVDELATKNPNVDVVDKYIDANTKILHHCLIHDIYWKFKPTSALYGYGCTMCKKEKINKSKTKSHDQYVQEVKQISPNIIVVEKYIDAKTTIKHYCKTHNIIWKASPTNILRGCGCVMCGNRKIGDKNKKSHKQYIEELKKINPNIVANENYIDSWTPILHKCLIDNNEWYAAPANLLSGNGCPQCNESKGERKIRLWLDRHHITYKSQKSFKDCRDIKPLPFDFYLPKYNAIIEYDGKQHFKPIKFFGGDKAFERRVKHDKIKNEYCKNKGISLLRIPYYKNVEEELNNFLFI